MDSKNCPKCRRGLPRAAFAKDKSRSDGLQCYCRECQKGKWQKWAEANREHQRDMEAARYQNPEYRARKSNTAKAWRSENAARVRSGKRKHYQANAPTVKARAKAWCRRHKEQQREIVKRWAAANPQRVKAISNRRRARFLAGGENFTPQEWAALCERYGHRCLRCGAAARLTADHITPLSKGGGNGIGNIQCLCGPCNSAKGVNTTDYRY